MDNTTYRPIKPKDWFWFKKRTFKSALIIARNMRNFCVHIWSLMMKRRVMPNGDKHFPLLAFTETWFTKLV